MIASGSFSGRFDLRVYDANTGQLTKSRSFPNLITNQGLASYCGASPSFYTAKICVGNGTTEPSPDDTILASYLAVSNTNIGAGTFNGGNGNLGAPDYISWTKGTARFNAGTFDGTTITEIGVTNNASDHPIWCRALILDEQGRPSSITVLANEYLDVTYTLYYHPDLGDTQFSFVMNGVTYNCTARAAYVNKSAFANTGGASPLYRGVLYAYALYNTQTLGGITSEPVYTSGGKIVVSNVYDGSALAYESAEPYTHKSSQKFSLGFGNFEGGIGAMVLKTNATDSGIMSETQVSFSPKIPKDANTEITFTFAKTVSRWTPPTP